MIVIGGGHAGVEAAEVSSRFGVKTLLITHDKSKIGEMSCNPAIGGIGKSHLAKEVDALGGLMARATDRAGIHYRVLNSTKGQAVRATRVQTDRELYKAAIQNFLSSSINLTIKEGSVVDLDIENSTTPLNIFSTLASYSPDWLNKLNFSPILILITLFI